MRHRTAWILGVILMSLVFQGDSCVLEQRKISAILGTSVPAHFETVGHTEATDSDADVVDVAAEITDAIKDIDIENIQKIFVAGGCYEVLTSTGCDAARDGTVEIDGNLFLEFHVDTNAPGTKGNTGDGTLILHEPGVTYINNQLNSYLAARKLDPNAPLEFTYDAQWTSTGVGCPSQAIPDNFTWEVCVNLQVDYKIEIDVPNP